MFEKGFNTLTPEEFFQALLDKKIPIDGDKMQQFDMYYRLLVEWNEKINLTAITDKEDVYLKHFYDSITLAKYYVFSKGINLCDVGSGAGFPSIPLKIIYPDIKVTIVDSLLKRIRFLEVLAEELSLDDITLHHGRAEDVGQNKAYRASFDLVTARAVARMSVLSELCLPLVKKGGRFLAMKGSGGQEELDDSKNAIIKLGGAFKEDIAFELPQNAGERHIYVIEKIKDTPKKYPRKAGTPNKNPIS